MPSADTAKTQLRTPPKNAARRVIDFMDRRVAVADPRSIGRALTGPLGEFWRYPGGASGLSAKSKMTPSESSC